MPDLNASPNAEDALRGAMFLVVRAAGLVPAPWSDELYLAADAIQHVLEPDNPRVADGGQIVSRGHREREARKAAQPRDGKL